MRILPSISIVGSGNVAEILGQRLIDSGIKIVSITGRNANRTHFLSLKWNCPIESLEKITGELILVAVSDESISDIINSCDKNKMVAYTSGAVELSEINHPNCGVFYPLQTFSKERILESIRFPLLIESKTERLLEILKIIGNRISKQVEICDSEKRKKIHISAVFINNFSNHMIQIGQNLAQENLINPELFVDLIQETFSKLHMLTPKEAQTGPAKRNDLKTIRNHIEQLQSTERELYINITNSILKMYGYEEL